MKGIDLSFSVPLFAGFEELTMVKRFIVVVSVVLASTILAPAQNTNSSTTQPSRTRTVAQTPSPTPKTVTKSTGTEASPAQKPKTNEPVSPSTAVLAAFNGLLDGIRHSNVKTVTGAYQNSPRLVLFNNNGTVTRGWEQLKQNREASYPDLKDVKLDVKDVRVTMLGRDAALITCLWTQSQVFKGVPETATGRMTIVFRKIGKDWKAIHLHTSPDKPDATRVMPSEQPSPSNP
jgi:ketosteroid isomerase-like protein